MPHLTTCVQCGRLFEASSEEAANEPAWLGTRVCPPCYIRRRHIEVTWHDDEDGGPLTAHVRTIRVRPIDAALARRLGIDPKRIAYDPDGEPWVNGVPLAYLGSDDDQGVTP